ncbi:hypothetical protein HFP67_31755 [Bacillus sp. CB102A.1]
MRDTTNFITINGGTYSFSHSYGLQNYEGDKFNKGEMMYGWLPIGNDYECYASPTDDETIRKGRRKNTKKAK